MIVPSSTSNSSDRLPAGPWIRTGLLAFGLVAGLLGGWDVFWRSRGFHPGFNDDAVLWSHSRRQVEADDPGEIVLIGASRIKIGIDLRIFAEVFGRKPVQLAIDGCLCVPVLKHLADCEDFRGTVVADVWPTAFYKSDPAPGGAAAPVRYYEKSTFSQSIEELLQLQMQRVLTFRLPDLSFKQLRKAHGDHKWPTPRHVRLFYDRSQKADYTLIKTFDLPMYVERETPPEGDPASKSPEDWLAMVRDIQKMVASIQSRGGQVVFAFIPSSDSTRQWEEDNWPRYKYWDVLAKNTTALTIHPDDYRSLGVFHCPDGSHLDFRDVPGFTRAFSRVLKDVLAGRTPPDYSSPEMRASNRNIARQASILEAPVFAEGFPPEAILREMPKIQFSATVTVNPCTMIFDLGQETQAALLQVVQYAYPGQVWSYEDYAWHVSVDRRAWIPVFDARSEAGCRLYNMHPTCTGFDLRDFAPFRYLRFTLRRARDDNRLFMRRLLLWSRYYGQDSLSPAEPLRVPAPPTTKPEAAEPGVDLAAGATLSSGPLFQPGHDFSIALRGREDEQFAESAEAGPTSLVIDLGWTVEAGAIEWTAVASTDPLHDCRWEISTNGEAWTEVFNAADGDAAGEVQGLKQRFSLAGQGPFRFLRLTARGIAADQRLRVRRVAIYP